MNDREELLLVVISEEGGAFLDDATTKRLLLVELHLGRESRRQLLLPRRQLLLLDGMLPRGPVSVGAHHRRCLLLYALVHERGAVASAQILAIGKVYAFEAALIASAAVVLNNVRVSP